MRSLASSASAFGTWPEHAHTPMRAGSRPSGPASARRWRTSDRTSDGSRLVYVIATRPAAATRRAQSTYDAHALSGLPNIGASAGSGNPVTNTTAGDGRVAP